MMDCLYMLRFDILKKGNVAETLMSVGIWLCACFPTLQGANSSRSTGNAVHEMSSSICTTCPESLKKL